MASQGHARQTVQVIDHWGEGAGSSRGLASLPWRYGSVVGTACAGDLDHQRVVCLEYAWIKEEDRPETNRRTAVLARLLAVRGERLKVRRL